MAKKRNYYSPDQKVQILKKHLVDRIPLSDICDKYDLHPTVFYQYGKFYLITNIIDCNYQVKSVLSHFYMSADGKSF